AYLVAMDKGRDLVTQKKYAEAVKQYEAAYAIFKTDAAKNGQEAAKQLVKQEQAALAAQKAAKEAELKKAEDLTPALKLGKAALDAKNWDEAIKRYGDARKLSPGNVDALAGLSRAERERAAEADKARLFATQMDLAQKALAKNNKAEAAAHAREAL